MSEFTVSTDDLTSASEGVRSAADSLDQRIAALKSRVDGLLDGGWKGQAADAFRQDWEQWLHGAKDVVGGLDSTARLLASNSATYSSHEDANAQALHGTTGGLNLEI